MKIDQLTKSFYCPSTNTTYLLSVGVTAWNKLCISYRGYDHNLSASDQNLGNKILSIVVDGQPQSNEPESINKIYSASTFDEAVDMMYDRVNRLNNTGLYTDFE